MAVSIMSACCRASVLELYLLGCFLQVLIQGEVFRAPQAHSVFLRSKRANSLLVEEILQGNLERECYEELCNYEEAREYYEDDSMTEIFWSGYYGNKCKLNPCLHGGTCTNKVGGFICSCVAPHSGKFCELGDTVLPTASQTTNAVWTTSTQYAKCPTEGPTACHQLCKASHYSFTCSCLPGFKLQSDKQSCLPEVEFPCGRLPENLPVPESQCHHGNFPWQVFVVNSRKVELCGGVLLGQFSVLTAARCLYQESDIQPYNFYVVPGNEKKYLPVRALYIHEQFCPDRHNNDLALLELTQPLTFSSTLIHLCLPTKDFSENILMHPGKMGITRSQGASQIQKLSYMMLDDCRITMNISHQLSNKMFCMKKNRATRRCNGSLGKQTAESLAVDRNLTITRQCGHLLPGMPVATVDRGTVFLTGLLTSSSTDCDGLVFTKLSRYLSWIKSRLEAITIHMTPQLKQFPELG